MWEESELLAWVGALERAERLLDQVGEMVSLQERLKSLEGSEHKLVEIAWLLHDKSMECEEELSESFSKILFNKSNAQKMARLLMAS